MVDRHLELVKALSIPIPENHLAHFDRTEPADVKTFADVTLNELGLPPKNYLCINPTAGWPSRVWPRESYAEIIRIASETYNVPLLAICGSLS